MNSILLIAIQLLLAHVLTDFVFQTKSLVKQKQKLKARAPFLYVHAALAGILTYVILQDWTGFIVPIGIAVTHFFIDLWKLNQPKDNLRIFLLDQFMHLVVLLLAFLYLTHGFNNVLPTVSKLFTNHEVLTVLLSYLIVIYPIGFIIGKATQKWQQEIAKEEELNSLKKAGRTIGIFERVLILTFILTNNIGAIGFLIGAKSILRFSDVKSGNARKQTEYVLIGTLMSFAACILIGSLVRVLIF